MDYDLGFFDHETGRLGRQPICRKSVTYVSGIKRYPCDRNAPYEIGSPTRARTWDLRINSPSLYQLSYRGIETGNASETADYFSFFGSAGSMRESVGENGVVAPAKCGAARRK
jgi:hypothetical protein